jgi:hypothetical protein
MKFHEFLPVGAVLTHTQRTDGQAGRRAVGRMDMTKIIGNFRDYMNAPKVP